MTQDNIIDLMTRRPAPPMWTLSVITDLIAYYHQSDMPEIATILEEMEIRVEDALQKHLDVSAEATPPAEIPPVDPNTV